MKHKLSQFLDAFRKKISLLFWQLKFLFGKKFGSSCKNFWMPPRLLPFRRSSKQSFENFSEKNVKRRSP
jgi:hypothetical protein